MTKIGRNEPCPCGSGKKYKKCCLAKGETGSGAERGMDELNILMDRGWGLLDRHDTPGACDAWLELWEKLKTRLKSEFKDIRDAESLCSGIDFLFNWCQDLETELANAGVDDPSYYKKRAAYCEEFCSLFPESDELLIHNMKRAIAESYCAIGDSEQGNAHFERLVEEYPDNIWSYIGWGDMYHFPMKKGIEPDYERAEHIYKMALGKGLEEEDVLLDRLNDLESERGGGA